MHWSRLKPYLWIVILTATLIYLGKALKDHAQEVAAIRIEGTGWAILAIALGLTLLAHVWTGWVWGWILQELNQPVSNVWAAQTYLKTNIAKYLPSNLLHLYGRTMVAAAAGIPLGTAAFSVLLEPLLLIATALIIALGAQQAGWVIQLLSLVAILSAIHPQILNRILHAVGRLTQKRTTSTLAIKRYPLRPLLGELGFLGLRSLSFVLTVAALTAVDAQSFLPLVGAFSIGWLLGFIIPGAPGGLGVFEATVVGLLDHADPLSSAQLSTGIVIAAVALYRLVSTLAEAIGAGLAWLDERFPLGQR